MNEIFSLIAELDFLLRALIGGFFMFLTLRYIMEGVIGQVQSIHGIVSALDNRVKTMNHDMTASTPPCVLFWVFEPDLGRISRADGKNDARRLMDIVAVD